MTQQIYDVLNDADLGMSIVQDGKYMKLTMLPLTLERRNSLIKQVKTIVEDGKIAVRNIRRTTVDSIRRLEKKYSLGKDVSKDFQEMIDKSTKKFIDKLDRIFLTKEKEINGS